MSVLPDAVTPFNTNAAHPSFTHTCGGSDRLLLVAVGFEKDNGGNTVSGITYNGIALSLVGAIEFLATSSRTELWRLVNPPAGTYTVAITIATLTGADIAGAAMSFTGVDQTTPLGVALTAAINANTLDIAPASAVGDLVFGAFSMNCAGTVPPVTETQENRWTHVGPLVGADRCLSLGSTEEGEAGTTPLQWYTPASAGPRTAVAVAIKPASTPAPTFNAGRAVANVVLGVRGSP